MLSVSEFVIVWVGFCFYVSVFVVFVFDCVCGIVIALCVRLILSQFNWVF